MPIKRCTLPNGQLGWKWGDQGKCYPSRAAAVRQAQAAYANGYREPVKKFNPYHDKLGRFTTADGHVGSANSIDPSPLASQLADYKAFTPHKNWDISASLDHKKGRLRDLGLPAEDKGWEEPFVILSSLDPHSTRKISEESQHRLLNVAGSELLRMREQFGMFSEGRPSQYAGTLIMRSPSKGYGGTHRTNTDRPEVSEIYVNDFLGDTLLRIHQLEQSSFDKHGTYFTVSSPSVLKGDTSGVIASIFRHELGHSIHYAMAKTQTVGRNLHRKLNAYVKKMVDASGGDKAAAYKEIATNLGIYATTSRREMAAEIFSHYTSPTYKRGSMDKTLEDAAEMMLEYTRRQNDKETIPPSSYRKDFFPILTPEQVDVMVEKLQKEGPFAYEKDLTENEDEEFE